MLAHASLRLSRLTVKRGHAATSATQRKQQLTRRRHTCQTRRTTPAWPTSQQMHSTSRSSSSTGGNHRRTQQCDSSVSKQHVNRCRVDWDAVAQTASEREVNERGKRVRAFHPSSHRSGAVSQSHSPTASRNQRLRLCSPLRSLDSQRPRPSPALTAHVTQHTAAHTGRMLSSSLTGAASVGSSARLLPVRAALQPCAHGDSGRQEEVAQHHLSDKLTPFLRDLPSSVFLSPFLAIQLMIAPPSGRACCNEL